MPNMLNLTLLSDMDITANAFDSSFNHTFCAFQLVITNSHAGFSPGPNPFTGVDPRANVHFLGNHQVCFDSYASGHRIFYDEPTTKKGAFDTTRTGAYNIPEFLANPQYSPFRNGLFKPVILSGSARKYNLQKINLQSLMNTTEDMYRMYQYPTKTSLLFMLGSGALATHYSNSANVTAAINARWPDQVLTGRYVQFDLKYTPTLEWSYAYTVDVYPWGGIGPVPNDWEFRWIRMFPTGVTSDRMNYVEFMTRDGRAGRYDQWGWKVTGYTNNTANYFSGSSTPWNYSYSYGSTKEPMTQVLVPPGRWTTSAALSVIAPPTTLFNEPLLETDINQNMYQDYLKFLEDHPQLLTWLGTYIGGMGGDKTPAHPLDAFFRIFDVVKVTCVQQSTTSVTLDLVVRDQPYVTHFLKQ